MAHDVPRLHRIRQLHDPITLGTGHFGNDTELINTIFLHEAKPYARTGIVGQDVPDLRLYCIACRSGLSGAHW